MPDNNYTKIQRAREILMPYGDVTGEELDEIGMLIARATSQGSILLELQILHILFRRPVKELLHRPRQKRKGK